MVMRVRFYGEPSDPTLDPALEGHARLDEGDPLYGKWLPQVFEVERAEVVETGVLS